MTVETNTILAPNSPAAPGRLPRACPCLPPSPAVLRASLQEANARLEAEVEELKGQCADVTRQADAARWALAHLSCRQQKTVVLEQSIMLLLADEEAQQAHLLPLYPARSAVHATALVPASASRRAQFNGHVQQLMEALQ